MIARIFKSTYRRLHAGADALNRNNILGAFRRYGESTSADTIRVLDVGCDDGLWTGELVQALRGVTTATVRAHGLEVFAERAQLAAARGVDVAIADASLGFPYADLHFDVVHANQVIEHVPHIDLFVAEIFRVLKPGGIVVASSENASAWHNIFAAVMGWQIFSLTNVSTRAGALGNPLALHRDAAAAAASWTHKTIFNYRGFKEIFEVHGFENVTVQGAGYHPLPPVLGKLDPRHAHFLTATGTKPINAGAMHGSSVESTLTSSYGKS